jgi:hypothetical protein
LKLLTREGELVVPGVFVNRKFYILTVAAGRATVVGRTRQQAVWRSRALILLSFLRLELHSSNSGAHQQPPGAARAADVLCGSGRSCALLLVFAVILMILHWPCAKKDFSIRNNLDAQVV